MHSAIYICAIFFSDSCSHKEVHGVLAVIQAPQKYNYKWVWLLLLELKNYFSAVVSLIFYCLHLKLESFQKPSAPGGA